MVRAVAWVLIGLLTTIVLVFFALRLLTDVPNVTSGIVPDPDSFENRYARFPWLAYAHIVPGVTYLLIAPFQLWRGFRTRHFELHRRMGRVAIVAGLLSGVAGVTFGLLMAFGGALQAAASVVFGTWFVFSLVSAYRAIRRRDITKHRRWMIRGFAIGLAVGTIRLWIGLFEATGLLSFRDAFGVAFWLAFSMHAAVAEAWLWWRPSDSGTRGARVTPEGAAATR